MVAKENIEEFLKSITAMLNSVKQFKQEQKPEELNKLSPSRLDELKFEWSRLKISLDEQVANLKEHLDGLEENLRELENLTSV
jgi:vacuolar-type H+-ATPase subunit I/STV1